MPSSHNRLERTTTNAILNALRKRGAFAEKLHGGGPQRRGLPDIIACYRGYFFAVETKREDNKPEPAQMRVHDEIVLAGGIVVVAYTVADVLHELDRIDTMELSRDR